MGRPQNSFPRAAIIAVNGKLRAVWRWRRRKFEAAMQLPETAREDARRLLAALNATLAAGGDAAPRPVDASPAWGRYLAARMASPGSGGGGMDDTAATLDAYSINLAAAVSTAWARQSISTLARFALRSGGFDRVAPRAAHEWLDERAAIGVATRNRSLAIASRFFRWAVDTRRAPGNPFAGVKTMREEHHPEDIVYCERGERDALLDAAGVMGDSPRRALALAFLAGMRRGEVFRAEWADIDLDRRRLVVRKSKTGKRRITPVCEALAAILEETPPEGRAGRMCPAPDGMVWMGFADGIVYRLREMLPGIPKERVAWNAWRHTFASRLRKPASGWTR